MLYKKLCLNIVNLLYRLIYVIYNIYIYIITTKILFIVYFLYTKLFNYIDTVVIGDSVKCTFLSPLIRFGYLQCMLYATIYIYKPLLYMLTYSSQK